MIFRLKWFLQKIKLAKKHEKNFRSGFELINKRKEMHEKYLIANRNKNKDTEDRCRGWLEALSWFVREEMKSNDSK